MIEVIDIGSRNPYPASALSNFCEHKFIFDKIVCFSPEGLLQSFKFTDFDIQKNVCKLKGKDAKRAGSEQNKVWQSEQILWWRHKSFARDSKEYQLLLDKVFESLSENIHFLQALKDTRQAKLVHSIGESDIRKTILTEDEFCSRLIKIRNKL